MMMASLLPTLAACLVAIAIAATSTATQQQLQSFQTCMGNRVVPSQDFFVSSSVLYPDYATGPKARIDRKPAGVFFAQSEDDVVAAVKCAVASQLQPVPRSGGHSYEVLSSMDGSLVIDLADMNQVSLVSKNDTAQTASVTVQSGARLGHVYSELDRLGGYNFNGGTCPTVGIGGHISGGGYGMVARYYGLGADLTTALRVVLHNGTVVTATATQNKDLYWALRGGGAGSFGIVTQFTLKVHKVSKVAMFTLKFAPSASAKVLRAWMDFFPTADARLTTQLGVSASSGASLVGQFLGSLDELNMVLTNSKLLTLGSGTVTLDSRTDQCSLLATKAYMWTGSCADLSVLNTVPHMTRKDKDYSKIKGGYSTKTLNNTGVAVVLDWTARAPTKTRNFIQFEAYGGVFASQKNDLTPWNHRDAVFSIQFGIGTQQNEPKTSPAYTWSRDFFTALEPYLNGGNYQNYCDLDLGANYGELYWGKANFKRLRAIKASADPRNVFRSAQSIPLP